MYTRRLPQERLPQELIDHIIDLTDLTDTSPSQSTIKACALVSRSFYQASRRATLSTLTLDPLSGPHLAYKFRDLLLSKPDLTRFVRTLRIVHSGTGEKRNRWVGREADLCCLLRRKWIGALQRLVELGFESGVAGSEGGGPGSAGGGVVVGTALGGGAMVVPLLAGVEGERWLSLSAKLRNAFVRFLRNPPETLKSLTVSGLRGVPLDVVRLCCGVENVVLNEINIESPPPVHNAGEDSEEVDQSNMSNRRIRRLHLDRVSSTLLLAVGGGVTLSRLEEFTIIIHNAQDLYTVSEVCKVAGESLKSLKIEESGTMPHSSNLPGPISLTTTTSNSLTHLSLILYNGSYPNADAPHRIASLLSPPSSSSPSLPSSPSVLQSLSITLHYPMLTTDLQALQIIEASGWTALSNVLSLESRSYPFLRVLTVKIWFPITNAVPGGNFRLFYGKLTRDIGEAVRGKLEGGLGKDVRGQVKVRVVVNDDEF